MNKDIIIAAAVAGVLLTSCATTEEFDDVTADQVGVTHEVFPATVTEAQACTQEANARDKGFGSGIGMTVGFGAGQLLGGGTGRAAAALGMAAVGALTGHCLTDAAGKTKCQRITVQVDGTASSYTFIQPVYKQIGEIPVGAHGNYYHGGKAYFLPDSYITARAASQTAGE